MPDPIAPPTPSEYRVSPRLLLLGGIDLQYAAPGVGDTLLAQSKVVALLAYLALSSRDRFHRRDRLVGLLWPELDQGHARAALRKAIHAVRASLGADIISSRGDEDILIPTTSLRCDAVEFSEIADAGRLAEALGLYRGELMPGFHLPECRDFDAWLDEQREIARQRAAATAWALAVRLESDTELTAAGTWARRAVRYSGDDERVLRRAMLMLDRLGDRAGALRICDEFAARVRTSLEINLSPESLALRTKLEG